MKIILRILLINITLLVSLAWSANLTSYQSNYNSDSDVWIELQDKPNNGYDWVGIYPSDSNNDWENVVAWRWAKDTSPTQVDQGDWYKFNLEDGKYEARFFLNNSFTVNSKVSFNVGDVPSVTLKTKNKYKSDEVVNVKISGELSENQDWIGVYPVGSSNDWENVLAWNWVYEGDNSLNKKIKALTTGNYEARLFFNNSFEVAEKVSFSVAGNNENDVIIGARPVKSTPKGQGKLFASPNGNGEDCAEAAPCKITKAFTKLSSEKNILFLRGGIYKIEKQLQIRARGAKNKPIIIESYPGEQAVLTAYATKQKVRAGNMAQAAIYIGGDDHQYIHIRKLEIKNMGGNGILIMRSSNNKIEGCKIHNNFNTGISIYADIKGGAVADNNLIIDNIIYNNSDVGLNGQMNNRWYNNGDSADGISIVRGNTHNNQIVHNTVYNNSDDGIDVLISKNSYIAFNLTSKNGDSVVPSGNGNGIKACGKTGYGSRVEYNIAFDNKEHGFDCHFANSKDRDVGVVFKYNTAYNNGRLGFGIGKDKKVKLINNIASKNKNNRDENQDGIQSNNSWDISDDVPFVNTDEKLKDFLRPKEGSGFEDMGAYANLP